MALHTAEAQNRGQKLRRPKGQPEWVRVTPNDPLYFHGVARASISQNPTNHKNAALQAALGNMANMIVVYLTNQDSFERVETVTGDARKPKSTYSEFYVGNTQTYTRNKLEGYERVGEWQGGDDYYVYVRLNKMKYLMRKRQEFQDAMESSQQLYDQAVASEKRLDMYEALLNLSRSLEPILPYLDRAMEAEFRGPAIQRMGRQYTLLNTWMSNIRIDTSGALPRFRAGQEEPLKIRLRALYNQNGKRELLKNFPLLLSVPASRSALVNDKVMTDEQGVAVAEFRTVVPGRQGLVLRAVLDTTQFGLFNPAEVYYLRGGTFPIPRRLFNLRTSGPKVTIVTRELNMGEPLRMPRMMPVLKDSLAAHGCEVVNSAGNPEFRVVLDVDTREAGSTGGFFNAKLDARLTVQDTAGVELLNESISDLRARRFDFPNAGLLAYEQAIQRLNKEILPRIIRAVYRQTE